MTPSSSGGHPTVDNRYRLMSSLGSGGMATVFRAWDIENERFCAIKVIHSKIAKKKSARRRFVREAEAMIRLDHPHVIQILDLNLEASQPYLVMEVAEGGSLDRWMATHGPMPLPLLREVMLQICAGISAAHEQGIIHRDLKPQNVLIDAAGTCRVTDFGIAQVKDDTALTKTGQTLGTWLYMAPEQRLNAKEVDAAADIYSLGVLLYALSTGTTPPDLCLIEREPKVLEALPAEIRPLVATAAAFLPEDRFASTDEMLTVLQDLELPDPTTEQLRLPAPPEQPITEEVLRGLQGLLQGNSQTRSRDRDSVSGKVAGHEVQLPAYLDTQALDDHGSLHQAGIDVGEQEDAPQRASQETSRRPWRWILAASVTLLTLVAIAPVGAIAISAFQVQQAASTAQRSMAFLKESLSGHIGDALVQLGADPVPLDEGPARCRESATPHACGAYLDALSATANPLLQDLPATHSQVLQLRTQIREARDHLERATRDHDHWIQTSETPQGRFVIALTLAPTPPQ